MPVQRPGAMRQVERCISHRIAAESEQILQPQLLALARRQQLGRRDPGDLIPQRPHGVETHRLMAGGEGDDVGVGAIGVGQVVVHGSEQQQLHEPARRDGATRVTG